MEKTDQRNYLERSHVLSDLLSKSFSCFLAQEVQPLLVKHTFDVVRQLLQGNGWVAVVRAGIRLR